jgi:dnd system-associated protein 4
MMDSSSIDENALMNIELDYYHSLFDGRLCPSQKDSEGKKKGKQHPFKHMWELFVYAAILGITQDKRKPIDKMYKPFRWLNIGQDHQKSLLVLTISKYNSLDLLNDKDELKRMIEEYANGGLSIINQEIKNNPSAYSEVEILTYKIIEDAESST